MLKLLTTKTNTIGKTALLLSIFTILSAFLAVIRDKIFATKFGAGEVLDIYVAAFRIPDLVFLLTATLISAFIIIPFLERKEKEGRENLQEFINKLFFTFSLFILIISAIVWFFMPIIAGKLFIGFNYEQLETLVEISRIMLLSPILMGLSFVFSALNQKKGYFFPVALTGVFYNLSIIFGTLALYPFFGFDGVVFGVVLGAFLYLLLQIPSTYSEGFLPKKIQLFNFKDFFSIFKIAAPRSAALALSDLMLIFLIVQATMLAEGSVTILNFAVNIFMVPITIIAVSYSVAVFPKLVKSFTENDIEKSKNLSRDVISRILFFGIPISLFFIFFSETIVGLLLGSEKFGLYEIEKTANLVAILSVAVIFQAISIMTVRIFYAMGKTWLPLIANIMTAGILIFLIKHILEYTRLNEKCPTISGVSTCVSKIDINDLAIAYSVAFVLGAFITNYFFRKSVKNFSLFKNSNWFSKFIISLASVLLAKTTYDYFSIAQENSFLVFFINLSIAGISFLIFFVALSEFFPDKNYKEFRKNVINVIKNKK